MARDKNSFSKLRQPAGKNKNRFLMDCQARSLQIVRQL